MDTGSHLVIGLGLAGLAYVDPVVASDPAVATAVFVGAVVGSQAPDVDGLLRMLGNAVYIRNHRGMTHSLPAICLWTIAITSALALAFGGLPIWHVGFWVLLAVSLHVFSDLFNTYGTQAGRPFTERWIHWDIIHIFDPFLFAAHVIAIVMWSFHLFRPAAIFSTLYILMAVYYIWRTVVHRSLLRKIRRMDSDAVDAQAYMLIPTISLYTWNVVRKNKDDSFTLGELRHNERLTWLDRVACADHPAIDASKTHPAVEAFLYHSSHACAELRSHSWGYEVRWIDVRYRHRRQYPFVAVVLLDHELKALDSYVGWLSDTRLEKKLRVNTMS